MACAAIQQRSGMYVFVVNYNPCAPFGTGSHLTLCVVPKSHARSACERDTQCIALFKILVGLLAAQVAMKEAAARDSFDKNTLIFTKRLLFPQTSFHLNLLFPQDVQGMVTPKSLTKFPITHLASYIATITIPKTPYYTYRNDKCGNSQPNEYLTFQP